MADLGRRVILPSSYLGGRRFISQCYQDSMAIVRCLGSPTFLITVTANPKWPEIIQELSPGETASDRPDITGRIFELKSQAILNDLANEIFGKQVGTVWTIEYQKRGLPYHHKLVFLSPGDARKYLNPSTVDRVIRAEIPTPEEDPDGKLRAIVESMMMHGPCGEDKPNSPCMKTRNQVTSCSKKFPKQFCE